MSERSVIDDIMRVNSSKKSPETKSDINRWHKLLNSYLYRYIVKIRSDDDGPIKSDRERRTSSGKPIIGETSCGSKRDASYDAKDLPGEKKKLVSRSVVGSEVS